MVKVLDGWTGFQWPFYLQRTDASALLDIDIHGSLVAPRIFLYIGGGSCYAPATSESISHDASVKPGNARDISALDETTAE
jgi:hypothetical protein